jgi:hypothetical protein
MPTEPIFVSKTRFYHITTKSEKNSGIFCQTMEFYGGIGGKTSQRPGNSDLHNTQEIVHNFTLFGVVIPN